MPARRLQCHGSVGSVQSWGYPKGGCSEAVNLFGERVSDWTADSEPSAPPNGKRLSGQRSVCLGQAVGHLPLERHREKALDLCGAERGT